MSVINQSNFTLIASSPWFSGGLDAEQVIKAELQRATPSLRDEEVKRIRSRTPVRTGGLKASISGKAYRDEKYHILVDLYPNDGPQLSAWSRIYAPYQEGPPLGLSTHTTGMHQMFNKILTDDIAEIEQWAVEAADKALKIIANGFGF